MKLGKPEVAPNDFLGRSESNRKRARYASKYGKIAPRSLYPSKGKCEISVDKLTRCPDTNQCTYDAEHVRIASQRSRAFYGWCFFTREAVESRTPCKVQPNAIKDNPNHVLIQFPESVRTCRDRRDEVALELANTSQWLAHCDPDACTE